MMIVVLILQYITERFIFGQMGNENEQMAIVNIFFGLLEGVKLSDHNYNIVRLMRPLYLTTLLDEKHNMGYSQGSVFKLSTDVHVAHTQIMPTRHFTNLRHDVSCKEGIKMLQKHFCTIYVCHFRYHKQQWCCIV